MKNKGITLVALVITIIILLILAGISISALTKTELIEKTKEAKEKTEATSETEKRELAQIEANEKTEETEYEGIKIPAGCIVSKINNEDKIDKGIVIIDINGNEWVWIDVPKIYTEKCNTDEKIENNLKQYALPYSKEAIGDSQKAYSDDWYAIDNNQVISKDTENLTDMQKNMTNGCGLTYDEYYELKSKMLNSIKNNGGFWIGRYELGDENATKNNSTRTKATEGEGKAVIKANQVPYNYFACEKAEELANKLSFGNNKCSILFGLQWDLVCKYLEDKEGLTTMDINSDSRKIGNYRNSSISLSRGKYNTTPKKSNTKWKSIKEETQNYIINKKTNNNENFYQLLTTGSSEDTKIMNIYDLAGNLYEYTLEKSPNNTANSAFVVRGGEYSGSGNYGCMSKRFYNSYGNIADYVGFRITMF